MTWSVYKKKFKKLERKIRARDCADTTVRLESDVPQAESPLVTIEEQGTEPFIDKDPPIPADYVFPDDDTQPSMQQPDEAVLVDHISDQNQGQGTSIEKDGSGSFNVSNIVALSENIELDKEVLEILGDDPTLTVKLGPETRKEIASRFQHIAVEGLSKDCRKELINKYPLPANCLHVGAPSINPEIKAALTENILKRDKGIETKQKEMASAISCLTELISLHLASQEKNTVLLQKLMDMGRILCDIQHGDSVTRRNFILFAVKNDMQEHLKTTKVGEQLSETIKSARAVNKTGADLKADASKSVPPPKKTTKPSVAQALNRKAAPQRRSTGAAQYIPRTREYAAPRAPHPPPPAPAYRTSLTRHPSPPPPNRRRY